MGMKRSYAHIWDGHDDTTDTDMNGADQSHLLSVQEQSSILTPSQSLFSHSDDEMNVVPDDQAIDSIRTPPSGQSSDSDSVTLVESFGDPTVITSQWQTSLQLVVVNSGEGRDCSGGNYGNVNATSGDDDHNMNAGSQCSEFQFEDSFDSQESQLHFPGMHVSITNTNTAHTDVYATDNSIDLSVFQLATLEPQPDGDASAGPLRPDDRNHRGHDGDEDEDESDNSSVLSQTPNVRGGNPHGFHFCPLCEPFATCDCCLDVLRQERMMRVHGNYPPGVYIPTHNQGMQSCRYCRLAGECDACGWRLRCERGTPFTPLQFSSR